jgi:predicted DNA-binding protein (MmcQ/YjbR family)
MDLPDVIHHCRHLPASEESQPFGPDVLVFKSGGKIFAIAALDDFPPSVNLKCDPDRAEELRDAYPSITPGYHMNKRHWNTLTLDGSLPSTLIHELIDHSYQLIISKPTSRPRKRSENAEK